MQRELGLVRQLESISGAEYVLTSQASAFENFKKDMGDFVSNPIAVVQPGSVSEVSQILKFLNERKIPVVARGGGTSLTGATSVFGGVVVDFSKRMNRILKIDTTNWFVHCEAGVVLDDLNQELSKFGFFFPPDPASAPWCTVGGVVAENSGGMRTFKYGTVKNWVLSLKVVLADGTVMKLGEQLPKNRVGYDFVHLICGSEGTLAVISEAWLKIAPLPGLNGRQRVGKFMVFFSNWGDAVKTITSLRAQGIEPNLLEFISREAMAAVNRSFDTNVPEHEGILFMEAESDMISQIVKVSKENGSTDYYVAKNEEDEDRLYNARALLLLGIKSLDSGVYNEDVVVPLDRLADFLEQVKLIAKKYDLMIPTAGHAGDGNVHPTIVFHAESKESKERADMAFADIIHEAIKFGGSVSGEHGIGTQKLEFATRQLSERSGERAIELMREIKKLWDPNNIMNPGKFITEK